MNIASLIIQNLRICPESTYLYIAVTDCDDNGEIDDNNPIINKLKTMLENGRKHNRLYDDLTYKVEGLREDPTKEELIELQRLSILVGLNSYERFLSAMRWAKFKDEHKLGMKS